MYFLTDALPYVHLWLRIDLSDLHWTQQPPHQIWYLSRMPSDHEKACRDDAIVQSHFDDISRKRSRIWILQLQSYHTILLQITFYRTFQHMIYTSQDLYFETIKNFINLSFPLSDLYKQSLHLPKWQTSSNLHKHAIPFEPVCWFIWFSSQVRFLHNFLLLISRIGMNFWNANLNF